MVARKREETEDFDKYKEKLKEEEELLNLYLNGRIWWQSFHRGQYVRGNYVKGKHVNFNREKYERKVGKQHKKS